jgi:hypothetical protein
MSIAVMPGVSEASVHFSDEMAASATYGPASSTRVGQFVENVGDLNGDDADDFAVAMSSSGKGGIWIIYGPLQLNSVDFNDLDPSQGFRITASSVSSGYAAAAGDQNGDGLGDVVVRTFSGAAVIYGVSDASSLAKCEPSGTPETRCIAMADPRAEDGTRLGLVLQLASGISSSQWFGADLEGDGSAEMVVFVPGNPVVPNTKVTILKEGLEGLCLSESATCTVSVSDLDETHARTILGPEGGLAFADSVTNLGDTNGDGREDLGVNSGTDGSTPPGAWVIYGQEWENLPASVVDLPSESGYVVPLPFSVALSTMAKAGDINGDGLADLAVLTFKLVPQSADLFFVFGREGTPEEGVSVSPATAGTSSHVAVDPDYGISLAYLKPAGDLNGDGGSELAVGNPFAKVDDVNGVGAVSILNSQALSTQAEVELGWDTAGEDAVTFVGESANNQFGGGFTSAGDSDGDGAPDLLVGIPSKADTTGGSPVNNAGELAVIPASAAYPAGITSLAAGVEQNVATLSGYARANQRESTAWFEYGETADYGSDTTPESIGSSQVGKPVQADLTELDADTEYHYRLVVKNDLGLQAYGQDRTFTTAAEPEEPIDPCEQDDTQPGCPGFDGEKFCEDNPNDQVCVQGKDPEKFCAANPTATICKPTAAGLSALIANSRTNKVKRGKKAVIWAWITSTGTKSADGVKVCAKAPKRKAKITGQRCRNLGSLAPGKTSKVKFKVKAKAHKGAKVNIKLVASAPGVSNKAATVRFTVR